MSTQARSRTARRALSDIVAEEIRVEMARQRLSQVDLADLLREGQPWVSRRLRGATPISVDDLERIAVALRVSVVDLMGMRVSAVAAGRREGSDTRPDAA